jgi:hypothetical protein
LAAAPARPAPAAGDDQGALRRLISSELELCAEQLHKAPRNESPWNYLRGLFSLPGCAPHLLATFPAVPVICREALTDSEWRRWPARPASRAEPGTPRPTPAPASACAKRAAAQTRPALEAALANLSNRGAAAGDWSCAPALATLEQYYAESACVCAGMGEWQQALGAADRAVECVLAGLVADPIHAPYNRFRLRDLGQFKKLVLGEMGLGEGGAEGAEAAAAAGAT